MAQRVSIESQKKKIKQAVYGEEVRDSIIEGLQAVVDDTNSLYDLKREMDTVKRDTETLKSQTDSIKRQTESVKTQTESIKNDTNSLYTKTKTVVDNANQTIELAKSKDSTLQQTIGQATRKDGELKATINSAESKKQEFTSKMEKALLDTNEKIEETKREKANFTQLLNDLKSESKTAENLKNSLDGVNMQAMATDVSLEETTRVANVAKNNLTAEIKKGNNAKEELTSTIGTATQKNREIGNAITSATDKLAELESKTRGSDLITADKLREAIKDIHGAEFKIVTSLPSTGSPSIIYLKKKSQTEDGNLYDEYIYVDNKWEKIGGTSVDMNQYVRVSDYNQTKTQLQSFGRTVNSLRTDKADKSELDGVLTKTNYTQNIDVAQLTTRSGISLYNVLAPIGYDDTLLTGYIRYDAIVNVRDEVNNQRFKFLSEVLRPILWDGKDKTPALHCDTKININQNKAQPGEFRTILDYFAVKNDVYTKSQVYTKTEAGSVFPYRYDVFRKTESDERYHKKADVYTKREIDNKFTNEVDMKADKTSVYPKSETYSKSEIDKWKKDVNDFIKFAKDKIAELNEAIVVYQRKLEPMLKDKIKRAISESDFSTLIAEINTHPQSVFTKENLELMYARKQRIAKDTTVRKKCIILEVSPQNYWGSTFGYATKNDTTLPWNNFKERYSWAKNYQTYATYVKCDTDNDDWVDVYYLE